MPRKEEIKRACRPFIQLGDSDRPLLPEPLRPNGPHDGTSRYCESFQSAGEARRICHAPR